MYATTTVLISWFCVQGWFFGDFFMEEFPAHLEYTGIYRCVAITCRRRSAAIRRPPWGGRCLPVGG